VRSSLLVSSEAETSLTSCSEYKMPALSELVLYSREEPRNSKPLNVHPLVIEEPVLLASNYLDWVLQKVKSFCHVVGMSHWIW
jgi:hypothetical protein